MWAGLCSVAAALVNLQMLTSANVASVNGRWRRLNGYRWRNIAISLIDSFQPLGSRRNIARKQQLQKSLLGSRRLRPMIQLTPQLSFLSCVEDSCSDSKSSSATAGRFPSRSALYNCRIGLIFVAFLSWLFNSRHVILSFPSFVSRQLKFRSHQPDVRFRTTFLAFRTTSSKVWI
jgi:hypothetical protein